MNQAKNKRALRDDAAQSRAFIEKAREIGADKASDASDKLLGRLAKTPKHRDAMKGQPKKSKAP